MMPAAQEPRLSQASQATMSRQQGLTEARGVPQIFQATPTGHSIYQPIIRLTGALIMSAPGFRLQREMSECQILPTKFPQAFILLLILPAHLCIIPQVSIRILEMARFPPGDGK